MSEKIKVRTHRFSNNKSLAAVLIIGIIMMFGYYYASQLGLGFISGIPLIIMGKTADDIENVATALSLPGGFLALFFYYWWYRPEYDPKPRNTAFAFRLAAPLLIYWFIQYGVLYTIAAGHITFGLNVKLLTAIFSMSAGVCEEVAFREVGISIMKRQLREDRMNLPIVIITAVTFGLTHFMNAGSVNAPFYLLALQAFWATMLGIFFGGIFVRTGNIWPCIIGHALYDLMVDFFRVNYDVTDEPAYIYVFMTVELTMLAAYGIYLIRKEKHPEIRKIWDEKWKIALPVDENKA